MRLPDANHFLKKRDFVAALTLLECDRKYAHNSKTRTLLGVAYCAFHNGDYQKAMGVYDELIKRGEQDQQVYIYKACCLYALGQNKEAKAEAEKCVEDSPLKMRLLFQLAQKLGDENEIMNLHARLTSSIED